MARGWAARRKVYVHNSFGPDRRHIGVFVEGRLISVVSIKVTSPGEYLFDITSPPRSDWPTICDAVYSIGWQLFRDLGAQVIYTKSPVVNGRIHQGSRAICEACGLSPVGEPEPVEEINCVKYQWQEYQLLRSDWLKYHHQEAA